MAANLDAPLVARRPLDGAYLVLTFAHPVVARDAEPGQYVMIKAGTSADPPLRRPFSILATDPGAGTFQIFMKVIGAGTRALSDLQPGEPAQCLGPLGRGFTAPDAGVDAVLVAGGYGVAPLLFFARRLQAAGRPCHAFYGGRSVADLQLREGFAEAGVPIVVSTDDGSLGVHGRVTGAVESHLQQSTGRAHLFACGPDPMLHAVARLGVRKGVPASVSLDPWMGCGVGTCLGCVVKLQGADEPAPKYHCACTEGPVFDATRVVWHGENESSARRATLGRSREMPA